MANTTESKKASKAPAKKKAKQPATPSGSQFERMGTEDSDDMEIERGLRAYAFEAFKPASTFMQSTPPRSRAGKVSLPSPNIPCPDDVIEITSSEGELPSSPSSTVDTSPEQPLKSRSTSAFSGRRSVLDAVTESSNPPDQSSSPSSRGASRDNCPPDASMAWLIEDDDDPEIQLLGSSPPNPRIPSSIAAQADDDNIEFIDHSPILAPKRLRKLVDSSPPAGSSRLGSLSPSAKSPVFDTSQPSRHVTSHLKSLLKNDMPPPALPARFTVSSPSLSDDAPPEPSFAVRAPGKQLKKRAIVESLEFSSSPLGMSPPPPRRIQRERPPTLSPPAPRQAKRKKRKIKDIAEAQKLNPWIDVAADHSGNDSLGSSDDDQLGSDDRRFVHELPETQVSPSYDQSAVYRRSLFTQAPGGAGEGPVFVHRPARRGLDAFAVAGPSRARHRVPSSPADPDDEYDFGSFVVDDDAEISFNGDSSSEP
ncbi:hypothetical protein A0H81_00573 [Grifola frondosa]|uniref:Uncharacterized protein n=1 Tax=Grifola frondosa TaxID=5627 RepID=A0A1C7MQ00_GRIFR|nr:hypothetical protein A0H81_00573 [Grifola frondosa]